MKESIFELDKVDEEKAPRRAIFEAGQKAQKDGYGIYGNPWDSYHPLEKEIWANGWQWNEDVHGQYHDTKTPMMIAGVVACLVVLLLLGSMFLR
jgi:hypothetical protein